MDHWLCRGDGAPLVLHPSRALTMWDDNRDNQLDRWADHGPALTWGGVWWSLGTIAVLVLLALLNAWRG